MENPLDCLKIGKVLEETTDLTNDKQLMFDTAYVVQVHVRPIILRLIEKYNDRNDWGGTPWKYVSEYDRAVGMLTSGLNTEEIISSLLKFPKPVLKRLRMAFNDNLHWANEQDFIPANILIPPPEERKVSALRLTATLLRVDNSGRLIFSPEFSIHLRIKHVFSTTPGDSWEDLLKNPSLLKFVE